MLIEVIHKHNNIQIFTVIIELRPIGNSYTITKFYLKTFQIKNLSNMFTLPSSPPNYYMISKFVSFATKTKTKFMI